MSPAEVAEPIMMPFVMLTQLGPRNHVLDRGSGPVTRKGNFEGKMGPAWTRLTVDILEATQQGQGTGMVQLPIGVYEMGCTLAPPGEYD